MKIPRFYPSTIDSIDLNDIEENSFRSEDISCLEIPDDVLDSLELYVNNEEISTGVMNFFSNTPMDDKTQGLLSDQSHEKQKIYSNNNTPTPTLDMSCVTSSGDQSINMEYNNVINGTRDLSKDLPKTKRKRRPKSQLGGQKHCLNVRWSKKRKRSNRSQKRRIWCLMSPVWLLSNPLREEDKNSTRDQANEVQPAAYMRTETKKFRSQTCSHCGTKETPQWRHGPKGPGSLCNACGIRYRTGNIEPKRQHSKRHGRTVETN